jgi:phage terminase large subunit
MQITQAEITAAKIELYKRGFCPLTASDIPPVLIPVFEGKADIRFSVGGRGGGKSWAFTKMLATQGAIFDAMGVAGVILCIREFMNSLDDSSLQDLKNSIQSDPWLSSVYDVGEKYIRTRSGRIKFIFSGTSVNLSSIKSKSRILRCFAEEAEYIQGDAWEKLIPTIREEGSELWLIYNPETENSWVHKNIRKIWESGSDPLIKGAEINWPQNPWFTSKMDRDRLRAQENDPDNYEHIWEGAFKTIYRGAYFTKQIRQAELDERIGYVAPDPLMEYRAIWDLGGTGNKADACAIWIEQWVGEEIRVLKYYEAVGQPMDAHVAWLRKNGYGDAICILPHDGRKHDTVHKVTPEGALKEAGFRVKVVPNQGAGAANMRIEALRRLFPRMRFDKEGTAAGLKRLRAYHEKWDDKANIGLGPNHDDASHGADAKGLGAVAYEPPVTMDGNGELEVGNYAGW